MLVLKVLQFSMNNFSLSRPAKFQNLFYYRIKKSILRRGDVVKSKWQKAALKIKLRNAAEANAAAASETGTGSSKRGSKKKSKRQVTVVDIARLAVADRDSNIPVDAENDDDVHFENVEEKTSL